MAAKTATSIVLVTVALLASAFVFAALVMDLPPGVLVTGQPAAVLGIRDY
jgi:hypothetical protein